MLRFSILNVLNVIVFFVLLFVVLYGQFVVLFVYVFFFFRLVVQLIDTMPIPSTQESDSRFAELLNPIRDLTKNFEVDIAKVGASCIC